MSVSFCMPFEAVYMGALCTDVAQAIMMSFCSYITYLCYTHSVHTHTYLLLNKDTFSSLFFYCHLVSSCQPSKCSLSFAFSVLLGLPVNDDSLLLQCFDEILWCRCHCCSHTVIRAAYMCLPLFISFSNVTPLARYWINVQHKIQL